MGYRGYMLIYWDILGYIWISGISGYIFEYIWICGIYGDINWDAVGI